MQYIKLRGWWFRKAAEKRYENWQKERLRGFEREETAQKRKNIDIERNKRPSSLKPPTPSTSTSRQGRAQSVDPLAKARLEWNQGIKAEYRAKFEKWTQQMSAGKLGMLSYLSIYFLILISISRLPLSDSDTETPTPIRITRPPPLFGYRDRHPYSDTKTPG